jgi:hypothetical protein
VFRSMAVKRPHKAGNEYKLDSDQSAALKTKSRHRTCPSVGATEHDEENHPLLRQELIVTNEQQQ